MSAKPSPTSSADRPIHRSDLEEKLREVRADVESVKDSASGVGVVAGIALVLLLLIVAFIIGSSRGKKKYAFVEIRRA